MDSNKKKTDELLNFDLIQDENIIIDNIKNFDLDAHFDSELNLDFELDFGLDLESNSKTTKSKKQNRKLNQNKKEEDINENQFEDLLSGFKDKYDINNKKLSSKAFQKEQDQKESSLLINSVIEEHESDATNTKLEAYQYDMLLKNIQIDNKQNIEEKQLNKFQKILGINNSEIEESYKKETENETEIENTTEIETRTKDIVEYCIDNTIDNTVDNTNDNTNSNTTNYNLKYLNLLAQFYLDFEDCDFKNSSQLFFIVSKLDNYKLVTDTSELKQGDIIKYPVVKYDNKTREGEAISIPDLIPVFFIKKSNNKLKVSKHNNSWLIWEDIPLFKKIND